MLSGNIMLSVNMNNQVSNLIFELFDVSREQAEEYSAEFEALVEAKSGELNASVIENQIPRIYGSKLQWRSQGVKAKYASKRTSAQTSYNAYINKQRR